MHTNHLRSMNGYSNLYTTQLMYLRSIALSPSTLSVTSSNVSSQHRRPIQLELHVENGVELINRFSG